MALSKKYRLPLRFERSRINKEGVPASSRFLTIIISPSGKGINFPRFAILVSKKVSQLAVDRNLLRRRVSDAIYPIIDQLPQKDYLIIPKKSAIESSPEVLKNDILSTLHVKLSN